MKFCLYLRPVVGTNCPYIRIDVKNNVQYCHLHRHVNDLPLYSS